MNISEFRQKYPDYNDMSDMELATALHKKDYSDMDFGTFAVKFGVGVDPDNVVPDRQFGPAKRSVDISPDTDTTLSDKVGLSNRQAVPLVNLAGDVNAQMDLPAAQVKRGRTDIAKEVGYNLQEGMADEVLRSGMGTDNYLKMRDAEYETGMRQANANQNPNVAAGVKLATDMATMVPNLAAGSWNTGVALGERASGNDGSEFTIDLNSAPVIGALNKFSQDITSDLSKQSVTKAIEAGDYDLASDIIVNGMVANADSLSMIAIARKAPKLAQALIYELGGRVASTRYVDNVQNGVPQDVAFANAVGNGVVEGLSEKIGLDVITSATGKVFSSQALVEAIGSKFAKVLGIGVIGGVAAGVEGLEEVAANKGGTAVDNLSSMAFDGPVSDQWASKGYGLNREDADAFVLGAAVGGPGGLLQGAGEAFTNVEKAVTNSNIDFISSKLNTGIANGELTTLDDLQLDSAHKTATEINGMRPGAVDLPSIQAEIDRRKIAKADAAKAALDAVDVQNTSVEEMAALASASLDTPIATDAITAQASMVTEPDVQPALDSAKNSNSLLGVIEVPTAFGSDQWEYSHRSDGVVERSITEPAGTFNEILYQAPDGSLNWAASGDPIPKAWVPAQMDAQTAANFAKAELPQGAVIPVQETEAFTGREQTPVVNEGVQSLDGQDTGTGTVSGESGVSAGGLASNTLRAIDELNRSYAGRPRADSGKELKLVAADGTEVRARVPWSQRLGARLIAAAFGHDVVWLKDENGSKEFFNGSVVRGTDDNSIFLNVRGNMAPTRVMAHELLHTIRSNHKEVYEAMLAGMAKYIDIKAADGVVSKEENTKPGSSRHIEEMHANIFSDMAHTPGFWLDVAEAMTDGTAQKMFKAINYITSKAIDWMKSDKAKDSRFSEGREYDTDRYVKNIEAVRKAAGKAAVQYYIARKAAAKAESAGDSGVMETKRRVADSDFWKSRGENAEDRDYQIGVERGDRKVVKSASLSPMEKAALKAAAEEVGVSEKEFAKAAIETKKNFPVSAGWAPIELVGLDKSSTGKISLKWKIVPYSFNLPKGSESTKAPDPYSAKARPWVKEIGRRIFDEVMSLEDRAKAGDKTAASIIDHMTWYREMAARLRAEFGSFGDVFADLLGATSPNTPVNTNWKFSVDVLRRFVRGDFDEQLSEFEVFLEQGGDVNQFKKSSPEKLITQITGKKYGMNSDKAMKALLGLWRAVKAKDAPKARNFALNLIGQSDKATIDVWAARMLQRLAKYPRVPVPAEGSVSGNHSPADITKVTGQFGFGQLAMEDAAQRLRNAGVDVTAPDLQAIAWFLEKEIWTRNNWTSKLGEGGSFEEEADKMPIDRWQAGATIATSGDPTDEDMDAESLAVRDGLKADNDVYAFKMLPTRGMYAGFGERSFDSEVLAKSGWNPTAWIKSVVKMAQKNNQWDTFFSRALGLDEENNNARPGIEVYFKTQQDMQNTLPVMEAIVGKGLDGFTLVVDPRQRVFTAPGAESDTFIGVRLQYVPEFKIRAVQEGWAEVDDEYRALVSGDAAAIDAIVQAKADKIIDAIEDLNDNPLVAYAARVWYDTEVFGKEQYDDYLTTGLGASDSPVGSKEPGKPLAERLKATTQRIERRRQQDGERGVVLSDERQPTFGIKELSSADGRKLTSAWGSIIQHIGDDVFRYPRSDASSLEQVTKDVSEGRASLSDVSYWFDDLRPGETRYRISISVPSDIGVSTSKDAFVSVIGDQVYINVAGFKAGAQGGLIYAIVGNFANNNPGMVFVGDPNGLSDAAVPRRLMHLASLATKFGNTEFLKPHKKQMDKLGAYGLSWSTGDDQYNLSHLLFALYNLTAEQVPEIQKLQYDRQSGEFQHADGSPVTDEEFDELAAAAHKANVPGAPGSGTIKVATAIGSILSEKQGSVPGERSRSPELLLESRSEELRPARLTGALYSEARQVNKDVKSWAEKVAAKDKNIQPVLGLVDKPSKALNSSGVFRPVVIDVEQARHAMNVHPEITPSDIGALPSGLQSPRISFKHDNGVRVFVDYRAPNGAPIAVGLTNDKIRIGKDQFRVTAVSTVFGFEGSASYVARELLAGNVTYIAKKEIARLGGLLDSVNAIQSSDALQARPQLPLPDGSPQPTPTVLAERVVTVRSDDGDVKISLPENASDLLDGVLFSDPRSPNDILAEKMATATVQAREGLAYDVTSQAMKLANDDWEELKRFVQSHASSEEKAEAIAKRMGWSVEDAMKLLQEAALTNVPPVELIGAAMATARVNTARILSATNENEMLAAMQETINLMVATRAHISEIARALSYVGWLQRKGGWGSAVAASAKVNKVVQEITDRANEAEKTGKMPGLIKELNKLLDSEADNLNQYEESAQEVRDLEDLLGAVRVREMDIRNKRKMEQRRKKQLERELEAATTPAQKEKVARRRVPKADANWGREVLRQFVADAKAAREAAKVKQSAPRVDANLLVAGMFVAAEHIESGLNFDGYVAAMRAEFEDFLDPYLVAFWEGARNFPGVDAAQTLENKTKELEDRIAKLDGKKTTSEEEKAAAKARRDAVQEELTALRKDIAAIKASTRTAKAAASAKEALLPDLERRLLESEKALLEAQREKAALQAKLKPMRVQLKKNEKMLQTAVKASQKKQTEIDKIGGVKSALITKSQLLMAMGGPAGVRRLFDVIRDQSRDNAMNQHIINQFLQGVAASTVQMRKANAEGKLMKFTRAWVEQWKALILTGFFTHITNLIGTGAWIGLNKLVIDPIAATLPGGIGAINHYKVLFGMTGIWADIKANMRFAARSEDSIAQLRILLESTPDQQQMMLETAGSKWMDTSRKAIPGKYGKFIRNIGFTPLGVEDAIFKTIAFKYELAKQVALGQEVDHGKAIEAARYDVFQADVGRFAQGITSAVNDYPALGFVIPFVKTLVNINKGILSLFPPAQLAYMAANGFFIAKDDVDVRNRAYANLLLGSALGALAILLNGLDEDDDWHFDGMQPADPRMRELWKQTHANNGFVWNGIHYDFSRWDPVTSAMALSVAAYKAAQFITAADPNEDSDNMTKAMNEFTGAIWNLTLGKNWMAQPAKLMDDLMQGDFWGLGRYAKDIVISSVIPNFSSQLGDVTDDSARKVFRAKTWKPEDLAREFTESVKRKIPVLREDLDPQLTPLGEKAPNTRQSAAAFIAAPGTTPVDKDLNRWLLKIGKGLKSDMKSLDGMPIETKQELLRQRRELLLEVMADVNNGDYTREEQKLEVTNKLRGWSADVRDLREELGLPTAASKREDLIERERAAMGL